MCCPFLVHKPELKLSRWLFSAHMTPVNYLFHRHGCVTVSLEQGLDFDSPAVSKFIDLASEQGAIDFEEAPTLSEDQQQYLVCISSLSNTILLNHSLISSFTARHSSWPHSKMPFQILDPA